ncbi:biotin-dependent carboxyltransferase family protein [Kiloniella antarctica]|uniref:Biotin-dependent carboxyltransferase family protein n=1 Tax=Kiloniella antarctica TaxID=1550907 RepID=A0ABW5BNP6_9PROT
MGAILKIISPGIVSSIQDQGRRGYAGFGVPRSGAADSVAMQIGNALVGNDPFVPAIEFRFLGPKVVAEKGRLRLGLAGNITAELTLAENGEKQSLSSWQTVNLNEGDVLSVSSLESGATGYLTVEGGIELTPILESYSTYARAKLGGVNGLPLQAGDKITAKLDASRDGMEKIVNLPPNLDVKKVRVMLGPQEDYFTESEIGKFSNEVYKVSPDVDRMGIRMEGVELLPRPEKGSDLISDGLVPGSIQIPGSGQPIILFVDCQTIGGYPKIATVITADLPVLGQLVPGDNIRFELVSLSQAQAALREQSLVIQTAIESISEYFGEGVMDLKALYQANLIGGVVDANKSGHFPGHLEGK